MARDFSIWNTASLGSALGDESRLKAGRHSPRIGAWCGVLILVSVGDAQVMPEWVVENSSSEQRRVEAVDESLEGLSLAWQPARHGLKRFIVDGSMTSSGSDNGERFPIF